MNNFVGWSDDKHDNNNDKDYNTLMNEIFDELAYCIINRNYGPFVLSVSIDFYEQISCTYNAWGISVYEKLMSMRDLIGDGVFGRFEIHDGDVPFKLLRR